MKRLIRRLWCWLAGTDTVEWPASWGEPPRTYEPPRYGYGYRTKHGEMLTRELVNNILERLEKLEDVVQP